jgi:hypothetical protein
LAHDSLPNDVATLQSMLVAERTARRRAHQAEQGPGGAAVNVIAYQGDYLMAHEELKVIDAATRGKKCGPPR